MLFRLEGVSVDVGAAAARATVLHDLDLEVAEGRCTALVGPSGAGKSTLLRLLCRLEEPSRGRVLLRGRPLDGYDVQQLRRRVGFVQQAPLGLAPTVLADLRVGRPDLGEDEAGGLLERVGLPRGWLDRDRSSLSGGESQRVCLARALAVGPEALLLDEPTSALDEDAARTVEEVVRGLRDDGLTTVLVSHDRAQARRLADDALGLVAGRLVAAGPAGEVLDRLQDRGPDRLPERAPA